MFIPYDHFFVVLKQVVSILQILVTPLLRCLPFMNVVLATNHTNPRCVCLDPHTRLRRRLYMHRAHTSRKWIVLSLEISMSFLSHTKINMVLLVDFMSSYIMSLLCRQYGFQLVFLLRLKGLVVCVGG